MAAASVGGELVVGASLPDFEYELADGVSKRLSHAWSDQPAMVVWPRHRG